MSDTITINGEAQPCRFAFSAIQKFQTESGLAIDQLQNMSLQHIQVLAKHGFNCGRKLIGKPILNDEEVEQILDSDFGAVRKVMAKFQEDMSKLFPSDQSHSEGNEQGKTGEDPTPLPGNS